MIIRVAEPSPRPLRTGLYFTGERMAAAQNVDLGNETDVIVALGCTLDFFQFDDGNFTKQRSQGCYGTAFKIIRWPIRYHGGLLLGRKVTNPAAGVGR